MTEASSDDNVLSPAIDWRMSASLENVPRGDSDLAEVTSLERAVAAWLALDLAHQADAALTPERPLIIGGVTAASFTGDAIAALAEHLPAAGASAS